MGVQDCKSAVSESSDLEIIVLETQFRSSFCEAALDRFYCMLQIGFKLDIKANFLCVKL